MKKIVFALIFLSGQALARDVVFYYVKANDSNNCKIVMYATNGSDAGKENGAQRTWSGRCANGFIQGQGTARFILPDGSEMVTTANFLDGKEQGPGTVVETFPNGAKIVFSGVFQDGWYANGTRTVTHESKQYKEVYEGTFYNGEKSGKGVMYIKSKTSETKYSGQFLDNKPNGFGTIVFLNTGFTWTGPFTNGKMNGTGRFSQPDGLYGSVMYANGERISEEVDPPAQLSAEQIQSIMAPQQKSTPLNCMTYGVMTTCQ